MVCKILPSCLANFEVMYEQNEMNNESEVVRWTDEIDQVVL